MTDNGLEQALPYIRLHLLVVRQAAADATTSNKSARVWLGTYGAALLRAFGCEDLARAAEHACIGDKRALDVLRSAFKGSRRATDDDEEDVEAMPLARAERFPLLPRELLPLPPMPEPEPEAEHVARADAAPEEAAGEPIAPPPTVKRSRVPPPLNRRTVRERAIRTRPRSRSRARLSHDALAQLATAEDRAWLAMWRR